MINSSNFYLRAIIISVFLRANFHQRSSAMLPYATSCLQYIYLPCPSACSFLAIPTCHANHRPKYSKSTSFSLGRNNSGFVQKKVWKLSDCWVVDH